jgi:signal peptidase I
MARLYSLRKSREILHWSYSQFKKKGSTLPKEKLDEMQRDLKHLELAILNKDREKASNLTYKIVAFTNTNFKKTTVQYILEVAVAVIIALTIAIVVRQMWFELYEIPTGSMRPSFKEQDHLTVSKTAFGLNIPLMTDHFLFEPHLIKRGGVVIFSGDGISLPDTNTTYFGIFPYKKRYVKRLIGKPGDTLYFYGGKIYGIDKEGEPIEELLKDPWMKKIEHIPFLSFEGERSFYQNNQMIFRLMNISLGKFQIGALGTIKGEIFDGKQWIKEELFSSDNKIHSYGSFWGIDNYAMARLLTKEELESYTPFKVKDVGEGVLYLELRHHPNLTYPAPHLTKEGLRAQVSTFTTVIPLKETHLQAIMKNLYTCRFVIKNGRGKRYDAESSIFREGSPKFTDIPDGTYEFYFGDAQQIGWKGMTSLLPKDHPLYNKEPSNVQKLFNLGIEMDTYFEPHSSSQAFSHRYAYFREGDLYLMGAPILKKDDHTLIAFLENEEKKAQKTSLNQPYLPFKDNGPPLKKGVQDGELIRAFGLKVPDNHYLVLGDNHAMSADSRVFGFVPENNLQGVPSLIFWPPGERWGSPPQTSYQWLSPPRLIVWSMASTLLILWYVARKRRLNKKLFT